MTPYRYPRVVCAAAIAYEDPTGVHHYDFMRTVANLRVAIVEITAINGVSNGTIPVLWRSKTTLKLDGVGFGYGDVYLSIQPYQSRCDGRTSTTADSWPLKMTSVNKTGQHGDVVLGSTFQNYIGNTTHKRGMPYGSDFNLGSTLLDDRSTAD